MYCGALPVLNRCCRVLWRSTVCARVVLTVRGSLYRVQGQYEGWEWVVDFGAYTLISVLEACTACWLVLKFAPFAAGSGISEVKVSFRPRSTARKFPLVVVLLFPSFCCLFSCFSLCPLLDLHFSRSICRSSLACLPLCVLFSSIFAVQSFLKFLVGGGGRISSAPVGCCLQNTEAATRRLVG